METAQKCHLLLEESMASDAPEGGCPALSRLGRGVSGGGGTSQISAKSFSMLVALFDPRKSCICNRYWITVMFEADRYMLSCQGGNSSPWVIFMLPEDGEAAQGRGTWSCQLWRDWGSSSLSTQHSNFSPANIFLIDVTLYLFLHTHTHTHMAMCSHRWGQ